MVAQLLPLHLSVSLVVSLCLNIFRCIFPSTADWWLCLNSYEGDPVCSMGPPHTHIHTLCASVVRRVRSHPRHVAVTHPAGLWLRELGPHSGWKHNLLVVKNIFRKTTFTVCPNLALLNESQLESAALWLKWWSSIRSVEDLPKLSCEVVRWIGGDRRHAAIPVIPLWCHKGHPIALHLI